MLLEAENRGLRGGNNSCWSGFITWERRERGRLMERECTMLGMGEENVYCDMLKPRLNRERERTKQIKNEFDSKSFLLGRVCPHSFCLFICSGGRKDNNGQEKAVIIETWKG